MNVYWDGYAIEKFLDSIASKIAKYLKVAIVQVKQIVDDNCLDLSVGALNDNEAMQYLIVPRKIMLPGEHGHMKQHEPIISEVFLSYINRHRNEVEEKMGKAEEQSHQELQRSASESKQIDKSQKKKPDGDRSRSRSPSGIYHKKLRDSPAKKQQDEKYQIIWIFCIPIDSTESQINSMLIESKLPYSRIQWKMREDMQYLEVYLNDRIEENEINQLDLKIDGQPLLVMRKKKSQNHINNQIIQRQAEINFEKQIDEVQLIQFVYKIGGVIAVIKDEYYGQRKYIVAFNRQSRVKQFSSNALKTFKNSRVNRPRYLLRLGRIDKAFMFQQIVKNIRLDIEETRQYMMRQY